MQRREEIVVELGGDSKKLMKELNMSKQGVIQMGRDIAKELTTGRIPDAWKSYSTNVKAALAQIDSAGKDTSQKFSDRMIAAAKKGTAAFLGFAAVKKVFTEINQAMEEVTKNISEFSTTIDASEFMKQQKGKKYNAIGESEQRDIVTAQAQKEGMFEVLKIWMAKAGAGSFTIGKAIAGMFGGGGLAKTPTDIGMSKGIQLASPTAFLTDLAAKRVLGKSFFESLGDVKAEQKGIWMEMKALKLKQDAGKAIEKQVKDEKRRLELKEAYNKAVDAEMKKWRQLNAFQRDFQRERENQRQESSATSAERVQVAADYNEQALLESLPGNPTAGERRNREQAEKVAAIRAYGLQKPKTIREQMEDRIAARQKPKITAQEAMNKLASIIQQDAMTVRVKLAK